MTLLAVVLYVKVYIYIGSTITCLIDRKCVVYINLFWENNNGQNASFVQRLWQVEVVATNLGYWIQALSKSTGKLMN